MTDNFAREFAQRAHEGQLYEGRPYVDSHVAEVVNIIRTFGFAGTDWETAGWLHDAVEDTPVTLEMVALMFGDRVATMVDACTGIGSSRSIRNARIYSKLVQNPEAAVVKLADRIANVEASAPESRHLAMYRAEAADFEAAVRRFVPAEMWARLERGLAE